jgi:SagB-type dehydrogenase family enzyme
VSLASPEVLLGIRAGVHFSERAGQVQVRHPWGFTGLGQLRPGTLAALRRMRTRIVPEDRLDALVRSLPDGAPADAAELAEVLARVPFVVAHHLAWRERVELSVTPISLDSDFRPAAPDPGSHLRLSRFAYCRRAERELVLESPLSLQRAVLRGPSLGSLVQVLSRPVRLAEVEAELGPDLAPLARAAVALLLGTGTVTTSARGLDAAGEPGFAEDLDEASRQWSFHDLLFHARSRRGRHDYPYGATFRFSGEIEPVPAVKAPERRGATIELRRPDPDSLDGDDVSLTDALEGRRSVRDHGPEPVGIDQLGEFLYRTARVRARFDADLSNPYERTSRPYPSGGAEYELELYLVVGRCRGLARGLYHYDALGHRLRQLPTCDEHVAALLRDAAASMGRHGEPDVLITITARFQRTAWKYESIAYSLTLKHVGVLYQTMYLVATAMGLAGCAIGGGSSDLGARALGLDYVREGSVGEFALGSLPAPASGKRPSSSPV